MFNNSVVQLIASVVVVSYLSLVGIQSVGAAQLPAPVDDQQLAEVKNERGLVIDQPGQDSQPDAVPRMTLEDRKARETILNGKVQRLEEDMNGQKGIRKNLLTVAVAAFSIGSTLTFGVNTINDAIDKISVEYPQGSECIEDWQTACEEYVNYNEEKRDAQDSLDAIKGIGGGIFIVGIASIGGYLLYTWSIRGKQQKIEMLQIEADTHFEARGLTPEYLRRNESVAAVIEEIENLKKKAGAHRTKGEIFSRLALGSLASGVFLVGLSNVSHTVVGNITVDENDPDDVQSREEALDKTDELKTVGGVLIGTGAAAGIVSLVFARLAKGKENQVDEYEDSLWRVAERIEFQPKLNGFTVMYTHTF